MTNELTITLERDDGLWRVEVRAWCGMERFEYRSSALAGACRWGAEQHRWHSNGKPPYGRSNMNEAWLAGYGAAKRLLARAREGQTT